MSGWANVEAVGRNEPHWYLVQRDECPVCGRGETHRTRMAGNAPADASDRYEYEQVYDYCMEWGSM